MNGAELLQAYDVSLSRGFLPSSDPKTSFFPGLSENFRPIEDIGNNLPEFLQNGMLATEIKKISLLDESDITSLSERNAQLLMVRLAFIAHAYVWENWNNPNELPVQTSLSSNLAVPLLLLAERFGFCPTLNYSNYAQWNWKRIDPGGPIAPENLKLIQNFLGDESEEWFVVMHVAIELAAASLARALWELGSAIDAVSQYKMIRCLENVLSSLWHINALMRRMPEHCDAGVYFKRVRPYLYGWTDKQLFPNGMLYQGRTMAENKYLVVPGETGAQSRIIPCLDRVLGITHEPSHLSAHLHDMLHYCTPRKQRNFVLAFEERPGLSAETAGLYGTEVSVLYWECRKLLAEFRAVHYYYAIEYIQKQARLVKHPFGDKATGGSPYMESLWKHLSETLGDRLTEAMGGIKQAFDTLIRPFSL